MNMLRVRPAPLGVEGLPEYLLRLADLNGLFDVTRLLRLTGAKGLSIGSLRQLAAVTGQSEAVIKSIGPASHAHWEGKRWRSTSEGLLRARARVCPLCLEEERVRRHVWRYQYSICCLKHEIMLVTTCPCCAGPISLTRGTATRCVCGHLLHESRRCAASAEVIEAQRRLLGTLVPPDHGVTPHVRPITHSDLAVAVDLGRCEGVELEYAGEVSRALAALRLKTRSREALQAVGAVIPSVAHQATRLRYSDVQVERSAFRVLNHLAKAQQVIEAQCHIDWLRSPTDRISPLGLTPAELSRATGIPNEIINALAARGALTLERWCEGARQLTVIPNHCVSAFLADLKRHMTRVELITTLRINDHQAIQLLIFSLVRQWCLAEPYSRWSLVPFDDVARLLSRLRQIARSPSLMPFRRGTLIPLNQLGTGARRRKWSLGATLLYIFRGKLDVFELESVGTGLDCFAVSEDALIRVEAGLAQQYEHSAMVINDSAFDVAAGVTGAVG